MKTNVAFLLGRPIALAVACCFPFELQASDLKFSRDLRVDIAINQVGYTPAASKQCLLHKSDSKTFSVIRTDGPETVFTGSLKGKDGDFGRYFIGDFSGVTMPGTYYIQAGFSRSFPFRIAADVYDQAIEMIGGYYYRYFMQPGRGWWVGINANIASAGIGLLRAAPLCQEPSLKSIAQRQLDWILGCNPLRASTVIGVGRNHPPPFINNVEFYPPTPLLPGAVMNGLGGTEDDTPMMGDGIYHVSEYWTPMVAYAVWLMAALQR